MSEGPTPDLYLSGRHGHLEAILLFVDFSDQEDHESVDNSINRILGPNRTFNALDQFFYHQSDSQFRIKITAESSRRTMPKKSDHYREAYGRTATHKEFIQDAINRFSDVDFSPYDLAIISATNTDGKLPASSNRTDNPGHGLTATFNGTRTEVRSVVTLGDDIYSQGQRPWKILAHELGHLFGFPDLYPYNKSNLTRGERRTDADFSAAGSWGMMSDSVRATNYLYWHRHKAGWLRDSNAMYLIDGTHDLELSFRRLKLLVVPIDDVDEPGMVYAIQPTPYIESATSDARHGGEGIIIYKVYADRATGQNPIEIQSPTVYSRRFSPKWGNNHLAVFHVNHVFDDGQGVTVHVTESTESSDPTVSVRVTINRQHLKDELRKRSAAPGIQIGQQLWSAENLRVPAEDSVCFQGVEDNCDRFGRMYGLEAAVAVCRGLGLDWRLPTDEDWRKLTRPLGGAYGDQSSDGKAGYSALIRGGSTRFDGELAGKRYYFQDSRESYFYDQGTIGYFWSSTPADGENIISYTLRSTDQTLLRETITGKSMISVRCVRDL